MDFDFEQWLKFGWQQGWISGPVCVIHDGVPFSAEEDNDFEEDGEPCVHMFRLYENDHVKAAVEDNFAPAIWRATNLGWAEEEEV